MSSISGEAMLVSTQDVAMRLNFNRCKLGATMTYVIAAPLNLNSEIKFHSCTDSDILYQRHEQYYTGTIDHVTNCKLGADYSAKMISTAGAIEYSRPLRFKLCEVYCAANPTITADFIHAEAADLQDDEFWIEVEGPTATADLMLGQITKSKPATITTTPVDLDNNVEAWTENLTGEIKQEAAVTVAGGGAGAYIVWACLAKPSVTVYVDPAVAVS